MWQTTRKKKLENNPNHAPKGSSKGGQFTKGDGGSGSDDDKPKNDSPKPQLKTKGKFSKPELKKSAEITMNKAIDSMPNYLKNHADNITLTDKPTGSGRKEFGGGYNLFTGEITIHPSGDQGYNNGVLAHELSHKQYDSLSKQKKDEWVNSKIMQEPITDYTKKILDKNGDKIILVGGIKTNLYRDEQYAELSRIINSEPTKYMATITSKSIDNQIQFFKKFNDLNESTEDVALSGDYGRADVGKKKKKKFEFKEELNDDWKELEHYLIEDATNSGQKSDTVGNPEFKSFTHSSSFVGNVIWDRESREMEILLNGNKYHFCRVSERLFDSFEGANSKGAFFNREIKTLHDC